MTHEPATHTTTDRPVGRRPSGKPVTVTVHRYQGGSGPTAYVQAAQHGIELNGSAALRRLHERLVDAELAGTVVAVPVANPLAFDHRSYMVPPSYDVLNPNLNRLWPGDDAGTFQQRMVADLWPVVDEADVVVDLHTGTADMLEHVRFQADDAAARTLARVFGTKVLLADPEPTPDADERGKFRSAAAALGLPAITVELGNSRTVSQSAVETGVDGVVNVLRELDVLAGRPADPPAQTVFVADADSLVASASGLFEIREGVAVGDRVEAGDELGAIYCPSSFERLRPVTAHESGVLYSIAREAVVVEGERLAAVATPE